MVSQKRKRESYATPMSNDAEGNPDTPGLAHDVAFTQVPFKIEYTKSVDAEPKKRRRSSKPNNDDGRTAAKEEAGVETFDKPITYMVLPGSAWEAMKKYKNFIVAEKQFGVNDYVYVNYGSVQQGQETDDDKLFWIARVLEVRASSPSAVYLRVYWMYWPSELPSGPEPYHGKSELVASNHMEIIDAMTVSGKAEVFHVIEQEDAPAVTGLYWRQKFDFVTRKVSNLKKDCICKEPHNPDKLLIHCVNNDCLKWMHEDCILEDAKDIAWATLIKLKHLEESAASDTIEVNGYTEPEGTIQVLSKDKASTAAPPAADGSKFPANKGNSRRKSKGKRSAERPPAWEGKLEARLQMKPVSGEEEEEEESTEITGKVLITDLRGEEARTWEEPLTCLFCRHALQ